MINSVIQYFSSLQFLKQHQKLHKNKKLFTFKRTSRWVGVFIERGQNVTRYVINECSLSNNIGKLIEIIHQDLLSCIFYYNRSIAQSSLKFTSNLKNTSHLFIKMKDFILLGKPAPLKCTKFLKCQLLSTLRKGIFSD